MANNKRRYRRIALKTVVTATGIVTVHGEEIHRTYHLPLEDLSAGGLRYRSKFPMPAGVRLELVFQLADREVEGTVEVVRSSRNKDGGYDVGCKFVSLNPVDQEDIIKYVTVSSVRDAQPSAFYSQQANSAALGNEPLSCGACRCIDCGDREACRACLKPHCGKRHCRRYVSGRQDLRRRS